MIANPIVLPFPTPPPFVVFPAIAGLAAANAIGEELVWRGALAQQLRAAPLSWQYAAQALTFGLAHYAGIPAGPLGVLATGVFGMAAFYTRRRYGLRSAILLHFSADLVIFGTALTQIHNEYILIR
ncbi:CPBP family intramembrane glutamic endopeptidase [Leifsonia poae]|uniref:CPBP family intramembrane glutamic endopeptidase n=1 Tax=Leifsonia poae TaxID=110933 RepID=UPI003D667AD7